jgi:hypothetical protein
MRPRGSPPSSGDSPTRGGGEPTTPCGSRPLIEPLDQDSVYSRFLAEKGDGVHRVAVATPNFDKTVAQADRRNGVILSVQFGGAKVAYLGTDRDLG